MKDQYNDIVSEEELLNRDALRAGRAREQIAAGNEYKEYVNQLTIFKALVKDLLAAEKLALMEKFPKASQAEIETRARASSNYIKLRDIEMDKLREAGRKRIDYDNAITTTQNAENRWKTMQSALSNRRAELKAFGA